MSHDIRRERRIEKPSPTRLDHRKPRRKKSRLPTLLVCSILILGLGAGFFYTSTSPIDEINLPVIMEAKEDACIKVRPDATENAPVPYSNISIYSELEERSKEPVVEQLLPEPEKPVIEAKKVEENIEVPAIEVVKVEPSVLEEPTPAHEIKQAAAAESAKPRETLNDAVHKTLSHIYSDASQMIVENVNNGKKMPPIEQPNSNLKIVAHKKPISEATAEKKETPKMLETVVVKKTNPSIDQPNATPAGNTYWVEFKPLSSSKEAEHLWHQLVTNSAAKPALVGAQHKINRHDSAKGSSNYHLSAGPFSKETALACCQRLRQAKVNCRVIKK